MPVYVGANSRASVYVGAYDTDSFYLGGDTFFPLWTPANLTTAPLLICDPSTFTWNATTGAFTSGTNTGSLGGTYVTNSGTPTKAASDIGGYDAIAFGGTSSIKLPSVTTPSGNLTVFYVSKITSAQPSGGYGALIAQAGSTPGWALEDQVNATYTWSGLGKTVHPGQKHFYGWPAGTYAATKVTISSPPADDGAYHISVIKMGTSALSRQDGSALTIDSATASQASVTGDIGIGSTPPGYGAENWRGNLSYLSLMQDLATGEDEKLEGWGAWKYNQISKIASDHKYKSMAPTMDRFDFERAADSGLLVPRRRLIVPDHGWKLAA